MTRSPPPRRGRGGPPAGSHGIGVWEERPLLHRRRATRRRRRATRPEPPSRGDDGRSAHRGSEPSSLPSHPALARLLDRLAQHDPAESLVAAPAVAPPPGRADFSRELRLRCGESPPRLRELFRRRPCGILIPPLHDPPSFTSSTPAPPRHPSPRTPLRLLSAHPAPPNPPPPFTLISRRKRKYITGYFQIAGRRTLPAAIRAGRPAGDWRRRADWMAFAGPRRRWQEGSWRARPPPDERDPPVLVHRPPPVARGLSGRRRRAAPDTRPSDGR